MTFFPIHSQISLQKREPNRQRRSLIVTDSNPNTASGPTGASLQNHKYIDIHIVMDREAPLLQKYAATPEIQWVKFSTPHFHWYLTREREIEREHPKSRTHQNVVNRITVPNLDLSIFTNSPTTVSQKDWVVGVWSLQTTESKLIKKYEKNGNRDWCRDKRWKPLRGLAGCVRLGVFEQWIRQICFFFSDFPAIILLTAGWALQTEMGMRKRWSDRERKWHYEYKAVLGFCSVWTEH